jgi:hypothetical protein
MRKVDHLWGVLALSRLKRFTFWIVRKNKPPPLTSHTPSWQGALFELCVHLHLSASPPRIKKQRMSNEKTRLLPIVVLFRETSFLGA